MKKIAILILAAGKGNRFGSQKQFLNFMGKEMWRHIYDKAAKFVSEEDIIVVGVDITGGITRSQSVINGLEALKKKKDYDKVVILEAARPLVTKVQMQEILTEDHDSCTFALPLVSTIVKRDGTYVDREEYYKLSTPVSMNFNLLYDAYHSGKFYDVTDETRVMYEYYGIKPYFLEGGENLLKLTYQSDLSILETLYDRFGEE